MKKATIENNHAIKTLPQVVSKTTFSTHKYRMRAIKGATNPMNGIEPTIPMDIDARIPPANALMTAFPIVAFFIPASLLPIHMKNAVTKRYNTKNNAKSPTVT